MLSGLAALFSPALANAFDDQRSAVFADGRRSTGWIGFELHADNRIYLPARVNGRPVEVMLDSGAQTTVLDRQWAADAGLATQGEVTVLGAGGTESAALVPGVDVKVGALSLRNLTVAAIDLRPVAARIGRPLPVILGGEAFEGLVVDIDFAGRRLAFHAAEGYAPPPGAREVPARRLGGLRGVPVSIEGGSPVLLELDLGSARPLLLYPSYWQAAGLLDGRPASRALSGAVGGVQPQPTAMIRDLVIGGTALRDLPAVFVSADTPAAEAGRTPGILGLPVLSRFRLITDFSRDRLFIVPDAEAIARPFVKDRLGLELRATDEIVVEFVAPGSPAEAVGFKVGDRIRAIDRKPLQAWPADALATLANGPAGTRIEFEMMSGKVRRVRLADYF